MESYNTEQVRGFARRVRDGLSLKDSWQRQALETAKNQAGPEGARLQRILDGEEE